MHYDWNFSVFAPFTMAFIHGTWVAIEISVISTCVGTVIGTMLGLGLRTRLGWVLLPLNDVFRAIPILVLLLAVYLFPYRDILNITPPSEVVCAVLAITISQAVFTADLVRSAVDGVSPQPILGARALGLRETTIWRYIVVPDIFRQVLPGLLAFFIANIKSSSLASVIGVHEILFVARVATGTTERNLEAWTIVAGIYVVLVVPLAWGTRLLERSRWLKRRY